MEDVKHGGECEKSLGSKCPINMPQFANPHFSNFISDLSNSSQTPLPSTTTKRQPSPKRIPRPMNAFMIFSNENRTEMRKRFPLLQNKELSKRLGAVWRKLSKEEQDIYYRKAKLASEDHRRKYPDYHYRPRGRGPSAADKAKGPVKGHVSNLMEHARSPATLIPPSFCVYPGSSMQSDSTDIDALPSTSGLRIATDRIPSRASVSTEIAQSDVCRRSSNSDSLQLRISNIESAEISKRGESINSNQMALDNPNGIHHKFVYAPIEYNQSMTQSKSALNKNINSVPFLGNRMVSSDVQLNNSPWFAQLSQLNGDVSGLSGHRIMCLNRNGIPVPCQSTWPQPSITLESYLRQIADNQYMTPPPSNAGSTSSAPSPPMNSNEVTNYSNQNEAVFSTVLQHNMQTPVSRLPRIVFPSHSNQEALAEVLQADCQQDSKGLRNFMEWDNSNKEQICYDSISSPNCYPNSSMICHSENGAVAYSNQANNYNLDASNAYGQSFWNGMPAQQQAVYMGQRSSQQQYEYNINSPLALTNNTDRQFDNDLANYRAEIPSRSAEGSSQSQHDVLALQKPLSVGSQVSLADDIDHEGEVFEDFDFSCDNNGASNNSCVDSILTGCESGIEVFNNQSEASRWDFSDDLRDVDSGVISDLSKPGSSSTTPECALLEVPGL